MHNNSNYKHVRQYLVLTLGLLRIILICLQIIVVLQML